MGGVCSVLGTNRLNVGDYLSTDGTIVGPANVKERASCTNLRNCTRPQLARFAPSELATSTRHDFLFFHFGPAGSLCCGNPSTNGRRQASCECGPTAQCRNRILIHLQLSATCATCSNQAAFLSAKTLMQAVFAPSRLRKRIVV